MECGLHSLQPKAVVSEWSPKHRPLHMVDRVRQRGRAACRLTTSVLAICLENTMPTLRAVDSVEYWSWLTTSLTTFPRFPTLLRRNGMPWHAKDAVCGSTVETPGVAPHTDFSCLITVRRGAETRTLFFDSGPGPHVRAERCQDSRRLGPGRGHHSLPWPLRHGGRRCGRCSSSVIVCGREISCYCHPDMFRKRALKQRDGGMLLLEGVPSIGKLTAYAGK